MICNPKKEYITRLQYQNNQKKRKTQNHIQQISSKLLKMTKFKSTEKYKSSPMHSRIPSMVYSESTHCDIVGFAEQIVYSENLNTESI